MTDKSEKPKTKPTWLTRAEAARYVGVNGESAIRAAEDRGLESTTDGGGQVWLSTAALDAFKWRNKLPTLAKRAAIVRQAQRAREHEARERERQEVAEDARLEAKWEATQRRYGAEDAFRASVRQKACTLREAFERDHLDERTAGLALGFESYEARYRVRDLVRRGLLRRVESPPEPRVEMTFDGLREIQSTWPLSEGGPFVPREDVLRLRNETKEFAAANLRRAPTAVQAEAASSSLDAVLAEFLRSLLDAARAREDRKDGS